MKHQVRVQIDAADPRSAGGGVVLYIYSSNGDHDVDATVVINEPRAFVLEAGGYFIEAVLPSGERLRESLVVDRDKLIVLSPSRSPHEWLAVQHLLVSKERLRPLSETTRTLVEPRVNILEADALWRLGSSPFVLSGSAAHLSAKDDEGIYVFEVSPPTGLPFEDPPESRALRTLGRVFVDIGETTTALAFPDYWRSVRNEVVGFQLVVNSTRNSVSMTVDDPVFAPILAYLSSGHDARARASLGSLSLQFLYEKMANPFAAAAGAYVLIEQLGESTEEEWRSWVKNLATYFPLLPDGAILHAHALLHEGSDKALGALLEAFKRGAPLFARGVRILLEDLLRFNPSDLRDPYTESAVQAATHIVRRYAGGLDPNQAFSTFRLPINTRDHEVDPSVPLLPNGGPTEVIA